MRYVLKDKTTGKLSNGIVTRGTSPPSEQYEAQAASMNATVETITGGFLEAGLDVCKIVDGKLEVDDALEQTSQLRDKIQDTANRRVQRAELEAMLATATPEEVVIINALIADLEAIATAAEPL